MKNKKILIVDDDEDMRKICRLHLEKMGFSVDESDCVEDAVLKIADLDLGLIILDLCMAGKHFDGTGMLSLARSMSQSGLMVPPIVVMSALKDEEVVDHVLDMGAVGYLAKPYDTRTLGKTVNHYFNG